MPSDSEAARGLRLVEDPVARAQRLAQRDADRVRRIVTIVLPWTVVVVLWALVASSGLLRAGLIPSPFDVALRFWDLLLHQGLAVDMLVSTLRVTAGVALGVAVAVPVGFVLGWYRGPRIFADPLINFFRALPPIALIPLVIVYFGIGEGAKITILFYAAFFSAVIVMYEGVGQISPIFVRVGQTLGATQSEVFHKIIVPLTVPHMLTALRVSLGVAWATLVASELIAARRGLGAVIQNASSFFQIDTIYVGIICIGVIALFMDLGLRAVGRRLLVWQERAGAGA